MNMRKRGEATTSEQRASSIPAGTTEAYLCIARTGHVDVLVALTFDQCRPGGEKISETAGVVNSLTLIKP